MTESDQEIKDGNGKSEDYARVHGAIVYKRADKLNIMHEIEDMLVDGYSSAYIMSKLGLAETTYYRMRRACFQEEKEALYAVSLDKVIERAAICDHKLQELGETAKEIAKDSAIDGQVRVNAIQMAGDIEHARWDVFKDGPAIVSQVLKAYPKAAMTADESIKKHLGLYSNESL